MKLLINILIFKLSIVVSIAAQVNLPCPAVNHLTGKRPQLNPTAQEFPQEKAGDKIVIESIKQKAIDVIGFFEAGGKSPWANVNYTDTLSLGFMQWNWGTGSLIDTFITKVSLSDIELAENNIRDDLKILKTYSASKTPTNKSKALTVIESWRSDEKRKSLNKWLETAEIKKIQEKIISKDIEKAFFYARA